MSTISPNSIISAQFSRNITELRDQISRTAEEATTGRWSDLTSQLSGRIGTAMLSQQALTDLALQRERLGIRESRLDVTQNSLSTIHNRVAGVDTAMRAALASGIDTEQSLAASEAKDALGAVFTALNVRFGERYMFAGDATATQPLASPETLLADLQQLADASTSAADFQTALDTYFNDPAGGWQTTIYSGTSGSSDPDSATAGDPALISIIRGLAVMALADPKTQPSVLRQNPEIVAAGVEDLSSGIIGLTNLRSDLGVIQERLESEKQSLDIEETVFTSAFNALTARDQYEAASALKQLESTLEASYLLTSRLSSLSLLNYLR